MTLLIPYTRFTLKTYLPVAEAEQRLAQQVRPRTLLSIRGLWPKPDGTHFFVGKVENGRFHINRIIHYRNSFLPIIVGQLQPDLGFTRVEITMRLHHLSLAILLVLFPVMIGNAFILMLSASEDGLNTTSAALIFVAFVCVFYLIIMGFFNYEANKARRKLETLFQTEPV